MNSARLLTLAFLSLAALPALANPPEQKTSAKGLTYSIRIPDGYGKGKCPLVVALHGAGDNCQNFMRWITGKDATLPKDAILLAPQALKNGEWDKEDMEPLVALIKDTKAEHTPTRTICFGFSRGSYYTFHLALTEPELFQGAIPHSGGLPGAVPDSEALRKLPFYVIHGDADDTVPVDESVKAVAALEKAKIPCKFDKIAGLKHTVDWAAVKRGFEWVNGILDDRQKVLDDEVGAKVAELEKAIKDKSWEAAAAGFAGLARIPAGLAPKVAALAKTQVASSNEPLALAAIDAAGRCGADGVPALKGIPSTNETLAKAAATALGATGAPAAIELLQADLKVKFDSIAIAAADALAKLGGDAATAALVTGLANCEALLPTSSRKAAILDALKKITGQTFAKSSEWKKWIAENAKK